ncbi:hypothetical protein NECAME_08135 [Necator americanus]|uniref:Uncharacterized protein n=1 Tax=Necator americanus TaxID=51031 RepID=W2TKJ2_NECAM|nr:hypothetical protein NECAME_08135 [Necator americanus]ETN82144.1 hypothetical protein NECAME_08135 [Necator americanus]
MKSMETFSDKPSMPVKRESINVFEDKCYEIIKGKECIIASQSRSDIPDLFIEDDQAIYIENACLSDSTASMKKLQTMPETVPDFKSHVAGSSIEPTTTTQQTESLPESTRTTARTSIAIGKVTHNQRKSVIDSYNVEPVVKTAASAGYGRRLRDARVKECFTNRELCALSSTHIVDGGDMQEVDGIVYHNRNDC